MTSTTSLRCAAGAEGCESPFTPPLTSASGDARRFRAGQRGGTSNALAACQGAGVRRFVHVGTEAALLAGQPLVNVDESAPLRPDSNALYSATKAMAEQAVRDANGDGFETVVVRPRLRLGPRRHHDPAGS